jgi:hypothetical protein
MKFPDNAIQPPTRVRSSHCRTPPRPHDNCPLNSHHLTGQNVRRRESLKVTERDKQQALQAYPFLGYAPRDYRILEGATELFRSPMTLLPPRYSFPFVQTSEDDSEERALNSAAKYRRLSSSRFSRMLRRRTQRCSRSIAKG